MKYSKILLIIKNALRKNSFYKSLITFIGIPAAGNGILQRARKTMYIAPRGFTTKERRGFMQWIILCK